MQDLSPLRSNPVTISSDGVVFVDTDVVIERSQDDPAPYTPVGQTAGR
jgi:hypothetical protein